MQPVPFVKHLRLRWSHRSGLGLRPDPFGASRFGGSSAKPWKSRGWKEILELVAASREVIRTSAKRPPSSTGRQSLAASPMYGRGEGSAPWFNSLENRFSALRGRTEGQGRSETGGGVPRRHDFVRPERCPECEQSMTVHREVDGVCVVCARAAVPGPCIKPVAVDPRARG